MKKMLFLLAAVLSLNLGVAQTKVGDVSLPNSQSFQGTELMLNGAGVREKLWIDLYAGGLYLTEKSSDANTIASADKPMAIKLHIISKLISSDKMIDAVNEGFENATNGKTAPLETKIEKFRSFFMEEIHKNDVFDLVYLPGKGVVAYKNDKMLGTIEGLDFKKALFGIWLSNRPADDDLKEAMLGK
ncbi:MAG: chalcone isomerase family protein [Bacteroidota bacterium]|uniref:Putative periplasmic protein n=1 Tax=Christiangramia flava JLT2011 TaxID=1229726 RepID=A0A1L7I7Z0_9FLAO|nr:chalcone isomerase family protein [Christiangramia flava]APU69707.1 putative periplasmic protein [Christiangramia flava JLT2011]MEE2773224.1 chalcone isomerase family protein [Bacteroidota bacterium]